MIKNIFLTVILLFCLNLSVLAENIQYKNIQPNEHLKFSDNGQWSIANKKDPNSFLKKVSDGTGNYSEFYNSKGEFVFSTGCQYEFIHNCNLIGYSNHELKFYEFSMENEILTHRELSKEEIQKLFKDFKIINISDFSTSTNSLRIKKDKKRFKIILFNDTDRYFYHYGFTSNNAKFETYPLRGFLNITKKGMIQFSHFGDNTKENPWFILLVR